VISRRCLQNVCRIAEIQEALEKKTPRLSYPDGGFSMWSGRGSNPRPHECHFHAQCCYSTLFPGILGKTVLEHLSASVYFDPDVCRMFAGCLPNATGQDQRSILWPSP